MAPGTGRKTSATTPLLTRPAPARESPAWLRGMYAGVCLYFFVCAINVMGGGLKMMAGAPGTQGWMDGLFAQADNPFVALMAAVLVTAIVQSSSVTTSIIIAMAVGGGLDIRAAIFAVMGANIGTSVTGIIVSFGNIRIRRQFRRAFTAALVHDIFNLLSVAVLFPFEWATGILSRSAGLIAQGLGLTTHGTSTSPVRVITGPVVDGVKWLVGQVFSNPAWVGTLVAVLGLLMLFFSLFLMVTNLRGALLHRLEGLFRSIFFRNDLFAGVAGMVTTVLVQSSSITTSLIVPLAGAGAVTLNRVFPFMLGANIGTTCTGVIAALAVVDFSETAVNEKGIAVTVAASHVLFNLVGILIWYPLKIVPLGLARWYGRLAARSKRYAFLFLLVVFVVIPVIGITITELLRAP